MLGKVTSTTVSTVAIDVVQSRLERERLTFSCGNAAGTGSVMLLPVDGGDPTTTLGFPLSQNGPNLVVTGHLARKKWRAIRLVAADTQVGVLEEWPEKYGLGEPSEGHPV